MKGFLSQTICKDELRREGQLPLAATVGAQGERSHPVSRTPRPPLKLDFRRVRLEIVLDQFYRSAGLIIRAKPNVQTGCMIDLCHEQPVSAPEALALLKKVLIGMGCTLVQKGPLFNVIRSQDLKKNWIPLPTI
jgi:hypothetical protein